MPDPDDLRSHDLSVLSERSAQDLDSAEGILGLLTGWAAERLRLARAAAEPDPEGSRAGRRRANGTPNYSAEWGS